MPGWLVAALQNGWIVGFAAAILLVETAALLALRHRLRLHVEPVVFNAISGIALMGALGGALAEPRSHTLVVLCLSISFAAHVGDIVARVRGRN